MAFVFRHRIPGVVSQEGIFAKTVLMYELPRSVVRSFGQFNKITSQ